MRRPTQFDHAVGRARRRARTSGMGHEVRLWGLLLATGPRVQSARLLLALGGRSLLAGRQILKRRTVGPTRGFVNPEGLGPIRAGVVSAGLVALVGHDGLLGVTEKVDATP